MIFFQTLKKPIIFGNHGIIKTIKKEASLNDPVYAINWFNTRIKWMYDFYNFLAAISVFKIGGKIFFKGKVVKILHGSIEDSREMLLIVNYPSANKFSDLMKDKYFLLVSLLRELAVKQFSFGFTERLDSNASPQNRKRKLDRSKAYAIHHFRTDKPMSSFIPIIQKAAESEGIKIDYAGQTSSLLFSQNTVGKETQVPCLLDGLFLFEGNNSNQLEEFLKSRDYQKDITSFDSSYIALINRTM
jgi:hypothetical protein